MSSSAFARRSLRAVALVTALGLLAGCNRAPDPSATEQGSEPVAAVRALATHLHRNEFRAFARAAVPPAEHARLVQAWQSGHSRWPLTELPLDDQLSPLLVALSAPDAERELQQSFNRNLARQDRDLKEAARALGLFGASWIGREGAYGAEQHQHYAQLVAALSRWAQQAPLGDPALGAAAIRQLTAAARATGLDTEESMRATGMEDTLDRLAPFIASARQVLATYGLDLAASHAALQVTLVEQDGDRARVRVSYPLAGSQVDTVFSLERRGDRWYLQGYLQEVESVLAQLPTATAAPASTAPGPGDAPGDRGDAPAGPVQPR